METLVQMAKRLGIRPNPKMNDIFDEQEQISDHIFQEMGKVFGLRPKRMGGISEYEDMYALYKYTADERLWDKNRAKQVVRFLKTTARSGVKIHTQDRTAVRLGKDDSFVWHSAENEGRTKERFQIDLKMDSANMEQMWQKLDDFIVKHRSSYKVVDLDGKNWHDRTDSLNVYMSEEITPEIAKELYGIIGPFLESKYDDFLAGFPVKMNGKAIKGFKYGPEPIDVGNKKRPACAAYIAKIAGRDLPQFWAEKVMNRGLEHGLSLGELACKIQVIDLIYYLAGKEGKNPFQIGNQFGEPGKHKYSKVIDMADAGHSPVKVVVQQSTPRKTNMPKLTCHHSVGCKGVKICQYFDESGKLVVMESYHSNCTKRVYANGLVVHMWKNPESITFTDKTKKAREATEIFVQKNGRYTEIKETTGDLRKKMEDVRKAGLFVKTIPVVAKKQATLKNRIARQQVLVPQKAEKSERKGRVFLHSELMTH